MNEPRSADAVSAAAEVFCAASSEDWRRARAAVVRFEQCAAGAACRLLEDVAEGRRTVASVSPGVYSLDSETLTASALTAIETAREFVAATSGALPILAIEALPAGAPTHVVAGVPGVGHVMIGVDTLNAADAAAALTHEFAHCVAISGLSFLDEGWATAIEQRFTNLASHAEWWERPTLPALLTMDWRDDPHFESLDAPDADAPYRLAAWLIETLAARRDCNAIVALLESIHRRATPGVEAVQAIERQFGMDLWTLDASIRPYRDQVLPDAAAALANGAVDAAESMTPILRAAAAHRRPGGMEGLAKASICVGLANFDAAGRLARAEASVAIAAVERGSPEWPLLDAYRRVLDSFDTDNPIERRATGARAANTFAQLLGRGDADPEILIAAAKAQTYTPTALLPIDVWRERLRTIAADARFGAAASALLGHAYYASQS